MRFCCAGRFAIHQHRPQIPGAFGECRALNQGALGGCQRQHFGQHSDVVGQANRGVTRHLFQRVSGALKQRQQILAVLLAEFVEVVEEGGVVVRAVPHAVPRDKFVGRELAHTGPRGHFGATVTEKFLHFLRDRYRPHEVPRGKRHHVVDVAPQIKLRAQSEHQSQREQR